MAYQHYLSEEPEVSDSHTDLIFAAPSCIDIPIRGTRSRFPVNRVFCVGRNYVAHAKEMGMAVERDAPIYFTKCSAHVVLSGAEVPYPPGTHDYHHEMELVAAIGKSAFRVDVAHALEAVFGYACGLDMTRRDLQYKAVPKGHPWDLGKDFEDSAVMAEICHGRRMWTHRFRRDPPVGQRRTPAVRGYQRLDVERARTDLRPVALLSFAPGGSDLHRNPVRRGSGSTRRPHLRQHR